MSSYNEIVPDKSAWDRLTVDEQEMRKLEWVYIKSNLKQMASLMSFDAGYLSAHKNLFFKGDVDKEDPRFKKKFGFMFSLFYLWYYPNLDKDSCRKIMEEERNLCVDAKGRAGRLLSIRHDFLLNIRFAQLHYESDYGLMGGREKLIIEELVGDPRKGAFFDVPEYDDNAMEFLPTHMARQLMGTGSLLSGVVGRRYVIGQYLWVHAAHYIQKRFSPDYFSRNSGANLDILKYTISRIIYFDNHPNTAKSDPYAIEAKNRIMRQYEGGEIVGNLKDWFDEVKLEGWEPQMKVLERIG